MAGLVQPIAVSKTGTHEDVVRAVAAASVFAFLKTNADPEWGEWLAGPFTKTVRRGTNSQFDAAIEVGIVRTQQGDAQAVAGKPVSYEDMGLPWSKMQVSGLERERVGWGVHERQPGDPLFCVNPHIEMSTGKTAAQVAHALFSWVLKQDVAGVAEWVTNGAGFYIVEDAELWDGIVGCYPRPLVEIVDAGFTEIAPQTTTVVSVE